MAPVSKAVTTATWVRRPSQYIEDIGSSSGEDIRPRRKSSRARDVVEKRKVSRTRQSFASGDAIEKRNRSASFAASDAGSSVNGRSYVDPWDMENYSFLRRQLEEVSISDNDVSSTPALESTQSDFYYVPLDGDGSPQYQYKHYVDANGLRDDVEASPLVFRDDTCGRVAGVDEHHFFNDYLDPNQQNLYSSYVEQNSLINNNPSRQSERSRYNNQDYQTYTPPSIMKDLPERHNSRYTTLEKNYRKNTRANKSYSELNLAKDNYEDRRRDVWTETMESRRKSFSDVKATTTASTTTTINRRQSFQDQSQFEGRRRRFTLDDQYDERKRRNKHEKINRRKSIHEIAAPANDARLRTNSRASRKSVLASTQSVDDLTYSRREDLRRPAWGPSAQPDSLVYVYETARRRRKMVLPNTEIYNRNYRGTESDSDETIPTIRSETYSMRPLGRYAMTNYGHLKIDYSCSWNNLHRYITDKIRG